MKQPEIKDVYLYRYFKKLMFIALWISGIALVIEYAIPLAFQSANSELLSTASGSVSSGAAAGGTSILNHIKYSINPLILTACVVGYIAACYLVYKSPDMAAGIRPTGLYILCPLCLVFLIFGDLYAFLVTLAICLTAIKLLSDPRLQYDEDAEWRKRREEELALRELEDFEDEPHKDKTIDQEEDHD